MSDRYLDLLKQTLTRWRLGDETYELAYRIDAPPKKFPSDDGNRYIGHEWPVHAETMVGMKRLDHLHHLLDDVRRHDTPGDFVECGIWRGGVLIFANEYFWHHDMRRGVWGYDSFQGLPAPTMEADAGDQHWTWDIFSVPETEVRANFAKYGSDMRRVHLVKGFFRDTVFNHNSPICILRVDGDMYEGTLDPLLAMYDQVSVGGWVVIDDYGDVRACREAVHDFRKTHDIEDELERMGHTAAFWRKTR